MKQRIFSMLSAVGVIGFVAAAAVPAGAIDIVPNCRDNLSSAQCKTLKEDDLDNSSNNMIWRVIQVVMGVLAGVAVVMIVIGGIKYTTSAGDPSGVSNAKNTIMYAVVGLVVALLATGAVQLVINFFG